MVHQEQNYSISETSVMEDSTQNIIHSQVRKGSSGTTIWKLENWKGCHKFLTDASDSILNIDDLKLRFFFRPLKKTFVNPKFETTRTVEYYSLCVQILSNHKKVYLDVKTETYITKIERVAILDGEFHEEKILTRTPIEKKMHVIAQKSAKNQEGTEIVHPDFFRIGSWTTCHSSGEITPNSESNFDQYTDDFEIKITATLHQSIQNVGSCSRCLENEESTPERSSVFNRMQKLLQINNAENPFADISLKMQDNVTLRGHRLILASASPVFEALFTSGLKETQTGIVEIPDVSSNVMKIVLEYMYTEKVDTSSTELYEQVIYAAAKYQLDGLMAYYDNTLITMCNPGNVVSLLKLANKFNLPTLSSNWKSIRKYMHWKLSCIK